MDEQVSTETPPAPPRRAAPAAPVSPRRRLARQISVSGRAWARSTFSREAWIDGLKTLIWVAPLTVLIWIYAEREQTAQLAAFPFTVEVRSPDPTRIVELIDPADGRIRADLSGPRARVDLLREKLESASEPPIHIDVDPRLGPGRHQVSAILAKDDPKFVSSGVTVTNCIPRDLDIRIDELVDTELDVQAPPSVANLASPPLFEPRKVKVTCPRAVLDAARRSGQLAAYADLSPLAEMKVPGVHDIASVAVNVPIDSKYVRWTPTVVSARVEVRKSDVSYEIPAMPVWVVYPPGMEDKYRAEYETILPRVTVTGPEEQIKALQNPSFEPKPKAMFEVSGEDLPAGSMHERRLKYDLPPGLHVAPEDAKRTIPFKLTERKPPE